jgi:hypothetical protein
VLRLEPTMMQQRLEEPRQEWERERADKDAMIVDLREDRDAGAHWWKNCCRRPKPADNRAYNLGIGGMSAKKPRGPGRHRSVRCLFIPFRRSRTFR